MYHLKWTFPWCKCCIKELNIFLYQATLISDAVTHTWNRYMWNWALSSECQDVYTRMKICPMSYQKWCRAMVLTASCGEGNVQKPVLLWICLTSTKWTNNMYWDWCSDFPYVVPECGYKGAKEAVWQLLQQAQLSSSESEWIMARTANQIINRPPSSS